MNNKTNVETKNYEINDILKKDIKHKKEYNCLTITSKKCFKISFQKRNLGMGKKKQDTTTIEFQCNITQKDDRLTYCREIILSDPLNFNNLNNLFLDKFVPNDVSNLTNLNNFSLDQYLKHLKTNKLMNTVTVFEGVKISSNISVKNTIFYAFCNKLMEADKLYKNMIIPTGSINEWDGLMTYMTFEYILYSQKEELKDFYTHYRECLFSMHNNEFFIILESSDDLEPEENKRVAFKYEYKDAYPPMIQVDYT